MVRLGAAVVVVFFGEAVDDVGGGSAFDARDDGDASAVAFDDAAFFLVDGVDGVVAAFGVDVGVEAVDDGGGGVVGKDDDVVDELKTGHLECAFVFGVYGASFAFDGAYGCVAVEAEYEDVAFACGADEVHDVAGVENVEAAVGPDDFLAFRFELFDDDGELVERLCLAEDFVVVGCGAGDFGQLLVGDCDYASLTHCDGCGGVAYDGGFGGGRAGH